MKANLKYQGRRLLKTALGTLAGLLGYCVFVTLFVGMAASREAYNTIRVSMLFVAAMYCVMFLANFYGNQAAMAIKFGATRIQWFLASLLTRLGFAVMLALGLILVIEPLANLLLTGRLEWGLLVQPVWLPLLLCGLYLLAGLGCLVGYLTQRFAKWGVIIGIVVVVVFGLLIFFGVGGSIGLGLPYFWQGARPWLAIGLLLAVCALLDLFSWLLLRRLAVKG